MCKVPSPEKFPVMETLNVREKLNNYNVLECFSSSIIGYQ